jgi:PUA domain protein
MLSYQLFFLRIGSDISGALSSSILRDHVGVLQAHAHPMNILRCILHVYRFSVKEDISGFETVKNSVARKVKAELQDRYPTISDNIDEMFPKKENMLMYKSRDKVQFLVHKGEAVFFSSKNGPFLPTLRLVHQFPEMLPKLQVDRGAIPFVLKGAPIMAVGITSKGGNIPQELDAKVPVMIVAEGKENAISVGLTAMSTADMKSGKSGAGVENVHFMGDGLWHDSDLA